MYGNYSLINELKSKIIKIKKAACAAFGNLEKIEIDLSSTEVMKYVFSAIYMAHITVYSISFIQIKSQP